MTTELGNTTLEDLGILTGIEGYRSALADPENWEARRFDVEWRKSDCWATWKHITLIDNVTEWRRKPEVRREPMRYVVRPIELHDDIIVGQPDGHFVDVRLRLPFEWNHKVACFIVKEIVDKPGVPRHPCRTIPESELVDVPLFEPPGTIITWQEAQRRVDVGLAVETPLDLDEDLGAWATVGSPEVGSDTPSEYPHWTYRIPMQPAQQEAVEMTWREALDWIGDLSVTGRMVLNKEGYACNIPNGDGAPYRPILFATRAQVELEKQLTVTRGSLEAAAIELEQMRKERASALGSQKAAVAALEVERGISCRLRGNLRTVLAWLKEDASVTAERDLELTAVLAGKESGV